MQYALFIYEDEDFYGSDKAGPQIQEIYRQHMAFNEKLGARRLGGAGLKAAASATAVRTKAGAKTVQNGPVTALKEPLSGFYLIEAADLDEAIAIAKQVPVLQDGAIEIRPMIGG
jgi:hypothetical protein